MYIFSLAAPRPLSPGPTGLPSAPPPKLSPIGGWTHWADRLWHDSRQWLDDNTVNIAIALCVGAAIVVLLHGLRAAGFRLCALDKKKHPWLRIIGSALTSMRWWFMIATAAELIVIFADAPASLERFVYNLFVISTALQGALFARDFILGVIQYRSHDHEALSNASSIISLLVSTSVFVIAIILMLSNLGVNVTGLVAGLGIGGIAIGLAAQGIFSDLFSALSILFDKPFRRGESIRWEQNQGTVETIGLKTTRIRSVTGEEIVVSNSNLLNKELHNLARAGRHRVSQVLGVIYQTPAQTCEDLPAMLREIVETEGECVLVRCGLCAFNTSSIDFELVYDVLVHDYEVFFEKRGRINLKILKSFTEKGINFAYPTQTTFTAAPDGKMVLPYPEGLAFPSCNQPQVEREITAAAPDSLPAGGGRANLPDEAAEKPAAPVPASPLPTSEKQGPASQA